VGVSNEPATKQDLAVRQLDENVSRALAKMVDKVTKAIHDSHAEILKAFSDMAHSVETRLSRLDELAPRMGKLEKRISQLERRKLPSAR